MVSSYVDAVQRQPANVTGVQLVSMATTALAVQVLRQELARLAHALQDNIDLGVVVLMPANAHSAPVAAMASI